MERLRSGSSIAARRWALIADDLTGACDAAAAFAQAGFTASVVLDQECFGGCGSDLLAYSTETRNDEEALAVEKTTLSVERLRAAGRLILFKKIDSVLRGSPLAEVEAVAQRLGTVSVVFNPALPAQGRLVVDGNLLLVDPETGRALDAPRSISLKANMRLSDAESLADLRQIAGKALSERDVPLFAGSAGLAEAVAIELSSRLFDEPRAQRIEPATLPALLLIGTTHPVTDGQVGILKAALPGVEKILRDVEKGSFRKSTLVRLSWDSPPQLDALAARLSQNDIGSLVLSGGDTARYVLDAFDAREIILGGEVEPGISWGRIRGGAADGLLVVTKSGGFGRQDLLLRILQAIAPADVRC